MDEFDMSVFDKHIGNDAKVKITSSGGVTTEFSFKPLPTQYIGKLFYAQSELQKLRDIEGKSEQEMAKVFDDNLKAFQIIEDLVTVMVTESYPKLPSEKARLFARSNFFVLMRTLLELNNEQGSDEKMKAQLDKFIEQKRAQIDNANSSTQQTTKV